MVKQMGYGSRAEIAKIHAKIVDEYELMRLANEGRDIKKILDILAGKYGYSSGQAVRNVIQNFKKKNANADI